MTKIAGRNYEVETLPSVDPRTGRKQYRLVGVRGAAYRTIRNVPNPDLMFVVREKGFSSGALVGVWLTDKNGTLEQVTLY